jgi:hypothetical protein
MAFSMTIGVVVNDDRGIDKVRQANFGGYIIATMTPFIPD